MDNQRIQISVVVITFNEEKNIGRCLESVKDIADEIVVVDSFSTDHTEQISQKYGVRFIRHAFEGHIEQKNYAMSEAAHHFVLSLDADEALSENLKESILKVKLCWEADGYAFNRLTNYCGHWIHHSGWYPDRKIRLLDKRKGKWGGINPHDKITMDQNARVSFLKGDLLHYSIENIRQHKATIESFSSIGAMARFHRGEKANIFKIYGHPLWKFIRNYVIRLGFLDGYYGFQVVRLSAYATYLRYIKLRNLWRNQKNNT